MSYEKKLLKKLAELEHEQWIVWSKAIAPEIDGRYYQKHLQRWKRLWVPYSELDESAKEQDREWARKVLAVVDEELGVVAQKIRKRIVEHLGDGGKGFADEIAGLLVDSGTLETLKIMEDKKLMKLLRESRKKGSKSSPYKPLVEQEGEPEK
jgi:hypothetical protein